MTKKNKSKKKIIEELKPKKKPEFIVDVFENMVLQDIAQNDEETNIKLNRDVTNEFLDWIKKKIKAKEQVKVAIKGETRSGKSLIGLKIMKITTDFYDDKVFYTPKIVCANQKELRQKLQEAEFGDSFLIDENVFSNIGAGSMSELQQLKDINNIIAKKNNHLVYITPRQFLDVGATMGLAYFGKDTEQWLSRFLLYSLRNAMPVLLGYVVIDVGSLFRDTGCLIFSYTGGCTNPNRLQKEDIPEEYIYNSDSIPEHTHEDLINDNKQCPFYQICNNPMAMYEHKKDSWIEREMKGGISEREKERYDLGLKVFLEMAFKNEAGEIKLNAKNGKEMKIKMKMKIPKFSNVQLTGTELDEIHQILISLTDLNFFKDICNILEKDYEETVSEIKQK